MTITNSMYGMRFVRAFAPGTVIAREGDAAHKEMYVLLSGSCGLYKQSGRPTPELVGRVKPGDAVAIRSAFLGKPPRETIVTHEACIMLALKKADVPEFFAERPDAAIELIEELCEFVIVTENAAKVGAALAASDVSRTRARTADKLDIAGSSRAVARETPRRIAASQIEKPRAAPAYHAPALHAPEHQPSAHQAPLCAPDRKSGFAEIHEDDADLLASNKAAQALFPPWHRHNIELPFDDQDYAILFRREFKCPICKGQFKSPHPRTSKLASDGEDKDLRMRYKRIEPMYYGIIVCPGCLFSASAEIFSKASAARAEQLTRRIDMFRDGFDLITNDVRDTFSIFASYYIALACVEYAFRNQEAVLAGLWVRIGRLYDDCGEAELSRQAASEALRLYLEAYSRCDLEPRQLARVKYTIGNLAMRLGDARQSRRFLFEVKTGRDTPSALKDMADMRLDELRAAEKESANAAPSTSSTAGSSTAKGS